MEKVVFSCGLVLIYLLATAFGVAGIEIFKNQYIYSIIYLLVSYHIIKLCGLISYGAFFLYGITLFSGSKIIVGNLDGEVIYSTGIFMIKEEYVFSYLIKWMAVLLCFYIGLILAYVQCRKKSEMKIMTELVQNYKFKMGLIWILTAVNIYFTFKYIQIFLGGGYANIYAEGANLIVTSVRAMLLMVIFFQIAKNPNLLDKCKIPLLIVAMSYIVVGVRANAIILLLYYFLVRKYGQGADYKAARILISILFIAASMLAIQYYRQDFAWDSEKNLVMYIIESQNRSFYTPAIIEQYGNIESTRKSWLGPVVSYFFDTSLSGNVASSIVMGELFYEGHGVGGIGFIDIINSDIRELGFLIIILTGFISGRLDVGKRITFLTYPFIFMLFYSHRSNVGYFLAMIMMFISVYIVSKVLNNYNSKMSDSNLKCNT